MTGSLRGALILRTGLAAAGILALAGLALNWLVARDMRHQFDHGLGDKAAVLASMVELTPRGYELDFADLDMTEFASAAGPGFLQLWRADGSVLYRSPSLADVDLSVAASAGRALSFHGLTLPGGATGRAVHLVFNPRREEDSATVSTQPPGGLPLSLVLARDTSPLAHSLARIRLALLAVLVATVLVVVGTLAGVIRASLSPFDRLAGRIGGLDDDALDTRLPEAELPAEFRPVIGRLNELFARLQRAFARERTLTADVAHELRTPLAALAMNLEVTSARDRTPVEYRQAIAQCRLITDDLRRLVDNLLALARIEAGAVKIVPRPIKLARLLEDAWAPLSERAAARRLRVVWDLEREGDLVTDAGLLEVAVRNLLDNAVSYADEGGTITVGTNTTTLTIANTGCKLSQARADELRDRFRRDDSSRTETGVHCGLGLSLVASICAVLDARLQVRAEAGGTYAVTLEFREHAG